MGALAAAVLASAALACGRSGPRRRLPLGRRRRRSTGVTVRAVVFDVGETLVDETRIWSDWADWLGIPRLTFLAVLGALIERGGDHREPFRLFRPEIDLTAELAKRAAAGVPDDLRGRRPLSRRRAGTAGAHRGRLPRRHRRQPAGPGRGRPQRAGPGARPRGLVGELGRRTSRTRRSSPGSPRSCGSRPTEIAYVGDRLDNDVRPAAAAGMVAIFIRRGPGRWIQAGRSNPPEAARRSRA